MIILLKNSLIFSNAVNIWRDKSILYSRIAIIAFIKKTLPGIVHTIFYNALKLVFLLLSLRGIIDHIITCESKLFESSSLGFLIYLFLIMFILVALSTMTTRVISYMSLQNTYPICIMFDILLSFRESFLLVLKNKMYKLTILLFFKTFLYLWFTGYILANFLVLSSEHKISIIILLLCMSIEYFYSIKEKLIYIYNEFKKRKLIYILNFLLSIFITRSFVLYIIYMCEYDIFFISHILPYLNISLLYTAIISFDIDITEFNNNLLKRYIFLSEFDFEFKFNNFIISYFDAPNRNNRNRILNYVPQDRFLEWDEFKRKEGYKYIMPDDRIKLVINPHFSRDESPVFKFSHTKPNGLTVNLPYVYGSFHNEDLEVFRFRFGRAEPEIVKLAASPVPNPKGLFVLNQATSNVFYTPVDLDNPQHRNKILYLQDINGYFHKIPFVVDKRYKNIDKI